MRRLLIILPLLSVIYSLTIVEIQGQADSSPYEGEFVTTSGYVTAVTLNSFFIQDADGAWNGLFIFDSGGMISPSIGDEIVISGLVYEYYDLTEIDGSDPNATYDILSINNSIYDPLYITEFNESYESVLVRISGVCTELPNDYGEWYLDDFIVDDKIYPFTPVLGQAYTVTGPLDYNFNNFKILPRNSNDIQEDIFIVGDLNQDNLVNVSDIIILINYILQNEYESLADLNEDGILNVLDVIALVNVILPQT